MPLADPLAPRVGQSPPPSVGIFSCLTCCFRRPQKQKTTLAVHQQTLNVALSGLVLTMMVEGQIPSSFSIQLKSDLSDFGLNKNRRLLNTEKLIFKVENHNWTSGDSKLYVLVTVEPEGIVGKFFPGKLQVQERKLAIFNIGSTLYLAMDLMSPISSEFKHLGYPMMPGE
ncbi:hypothetical protein QJS04_geneDACA023031 [Acorus gramineus]|uniref:Galectin n=1 Tax=Acorus gramineus TaxID=55184 RepID=A0AAV9A7S2_ACOGR|nr:hypothetical protein QJS04_geneDACA023031 [Acorus gramineus]